MAETGEALTLDLLLDMHGTIARTREALEELEQAINWSRDHDGPLHRRLLAAVARPFYFIARLPVIAPEIARLSANEDGSDVTSGLLMVARGMVEGLTYDSTEVLKWTEAAVRCHRRTADRRTLLSTMSGYAHWLTLAGRPRDARTIIAEALELAKRESDHRIRDQLEGTLAFAAVAEGDYDQAEARLQGILARPERTDFAAVAAISYMGDCALGRGDAAVAMNRYIESLRIEMAQTDANNSVLQLVGIAASLAMLGRDEEAARLIGAVEHISSELRMNSALLMSGAVVAAALRELEQRLGPSGWARQRAQGCTLTLDQAAEAAYALAGGQPQRTELTPHERNGSELPLAAEK
jgi:tetratricopeptide (TPR) repeat protein